MGIIRKATLCTVGLGAGAVGYLGLSTTIISPLPDDDPLWRSKSYAKFNSHRNASTQDICVKRIPLSKIKPELLQHEGDLALEFCRGVWSGIGETPMMRAISRNTSTAICLLTQLLVSRDARLPVPACISCPQIPRPRHCRPAVDC